MENKFADSHCDTISRIYENGESLFENSGHLDLKRMQEAVLGLQFFAVFVSPCENPYEKACNMIMKYHEECAKNLNIVSKIRTKWDFEEEKINAVLTIEGGHILEGKIERVRELHDMGVRLMTLVWNGENELGQGAINKAENVIARQASSEPWQSMEREFGLPRHKVPRNDVFPYKGLTSFGIEVIKEMEKLKMFIDVSHLNENGFWDVIKHTKKETPIFATHSNSKTVCDHKRNLSDEQIVAIIERKGYIGLNLYPPFFGGVDLKLLNRHIRHILTLGGEDCLGLGCDLDGVDSLPKGFRGVEDMGKVVSLVEKEFGRELAEKICGKNLQRFFR